MALALDQRHGVTYGWLNEKEEGFIANPSAFSQDLHYKGFSCLFLIVIC